MRISDWSSDVCSSDLRITSRVPQTDEDGNSYLKRYETTPGRMLLGECLPKSHKVPFDIVNRLLTKKDVGDVIDEVYRHTGQKETVLFADALIDRKSVV